MFVCLDASQWIYDRVCGQSSMTEFLANHTDIQEEDENMIEGDDEPRQERRDSENFQLPDLDDETKAKLLSCMDEIRGVIGDASVTDKYLVETIIKFEYDCAKALDFLLNNPVSASPATTSLASSTKQDEPDDAPVEKGKTKCFCYIRCQLILLHFCFLFVFDIILLLNQTNTCGKVRLRPK